MPVIIDLTLVTCNPVSRDWLTVEQAGHSPGNGRSLAPLNKMSSWWRMLRKLRGVVRRQGGILKYGLNPAARVVDNRLDFDLNEQDLAEIQQLAGH